MTHLPHLYIVSPLHRPIHTRVRSTESQDKVEERLGLEAFIQYASNIVNIAVVEEAQAISRTSRRRGIGRVSGLKNIFIYSFL